MLKLESGFRIVAILEESRLGQNVFSDGLKTANDVLITALGSPAHVPSMIQYLLVRREELVQVIDCSRILVQELRLSWRSFSGFDKIQTIQGCTISLEQIVEM